MDTGVKKKPKKPLTPLQQNRLLKIILGLVVVSALWILFAPGTGVYSLLKLRNQAIELEKQTRELTLINEELRAEIERLNNDTAYLEQIAREKYGMLKKNERVFDFSKPQKTTSKN
jgi:cell division protein FtsB